MTQIPNPHEGPSNEDWFQLADHSQLEHLTDKIASRPRHLDVADIALKHADEGIQARWEKFAAGNPIDEQHPQQKRTA